MCTNILLKNKKKNIAISARTMDFGIKFNTHIFKTNRGGHHIGNGEKASTETTYFPEFEKWQNQYGYITAAVLLTDNENKSKYKPPHITVDGINEHGLSAASLWLPNTQWPRLKGGHNLSFSSVIDYALGTCTTIQEVGLALVKVNVVGVDKYTPTHFIFTDVSGQSLVVEFENEYMSTYHVENGILTNAPFYHEQLDNLANYKNLSFKNKRPEFGGRAINGSGLLGMPGDSTPKSRFVKATQFSKINFEPQGQQDAITQVSQVIGSFYVPTGTILKAETTKDTIADYTQWNVIREHGGYGEINYYFQTQKNPTLYKIELDKLDWNDHDDLSININQNDWCINKTQMLKN